MQTILISQAYEGMILAKGIETPEGRILCGAGTMLSKTLIDRLIKMEISHLTVEGHPIPVEGEKGLEEILQDIERRFSKVTDSAPLMYLKKIILEKEKEQRNH